MKNRGGEAYLEMTPLYYDDIINLYDSKYDDGVVTSNVEYGLVVKKVMQGMLLKDWYY